MDDIVSTLHPAAAVFRTVIADELAMENNGFRHDAARLQPLLEHIQKIEMIGMVDGDVPTTVAEEEQDGEVVRVRPKWKVLSTVKLSDGAVEDDVDDYFNDGGADRSLSILSFPVATDVLQLKNLGMFGGVIVMLAGKKLGHFPQTIRSGRSGNICENSLVHINDDDTAILTIFVSDNICIRGELTGLTEEDIIEFREEEGNEPHLKFYIGRFLPSSPPGYEDEDEIRFRPPNSPIFKPTSIIMKITPNIQHTLQLIASTKESAEWEPDDTCPSEELRFSTIAALGTFEHKSLLIDNRTLKKQCSALMSIRDKLMVIHIADGDSVMRFSLGDGERTTDSKGNSLWSVRVGDKENSSMPVNNIRYTRVYLSGILLNQRGYFYTMEEPDWAEPDGPDDESLGIWIPFSPSVKVLAYFELSGRDEAETADILRNFRAKLGSAFFGEGMRYGDGTPVPTFPPTFKMTIREVKFSLASVEHVLNMVGLDEKLDLNENETVDRTHWEAAANLLG
jgi:hypothetical protein